MVSIAAHHQGRCFQLISTKDSTGESKMRFSITAWLRSASLLIFLSVQFVGGVHAQVKEEVVLQIGAFPLREDAILLQARVKSIGLDAAIEAKELAGMVLYRVRIGPYTSLQVAESDQRRLRENGFDPVPVKINSSLSANEATSHYVIAGFYPNEEKTKANAARFLIHGFTAEAKTSEMLGKKIYYVRIGPFSSEKEASWALNRIRADGFKPGALYVADSQHLAVPQRDSSVANPATPPTRQAQSAVLDGKGVASCKSSTLGTQMSAAEPVPSDGNGDWYYWNSSLQRPFPSDSGGCSQVKQAQRAAENCRYFGGQCISVGGCPRYSALATPKDRSYAWVGCGNSANEASQAAIHICELKSGCSCRVERVGSIPTLAC
ncbi:MAG: SPOR domain-containing protein [Burkholderiales bacterium]|nr:SPOR domain-containing protein [Burkholderiales bacterium]